MAAVTALALSACGGDGAGGEGGNGVSPGLPGGPGDPPVRLEGAWSGSFEIDPARGDARWLVLPGGEYWILYGGQGGGGFAVDGFVQGSGVSTDGKFASADARDFFGIDPAVAGTLEASYTNQSLLGAASFPQWTIDFAGAPIPSTSYDYDAPAALADIVGLWPMRLMDGTPVDVTVQPDGRFSGIDSSNFGGPKCQFTGTMAARPGENVFDAVVEFGPACFLANQFITGVGFTYTIAGTAVREFLVAGVNGIRGRGMALHGTR